MWANLIVNISTEEGTGFAKRLIDVMQNLTSLDARLLKLIWFMYNARLNYLKQRFQSWSNDGIYSHHPKAIVLNYDMLKTEFDEKALIIDVGLETFLIMD